MQKPVVNDSDNCTYRAFGPPPHPSSSAALHLPSPAVAALIVYVLAFGLQVRRVGDLGGILGLGGLQLSVVGGVFRHVGVAELFLGALMVWYRGIRRVVAREV